MKEFINKIKEQLIKGFNSKKLPKDENWNVFSQYQKLSEEFMRGFKDVVDWHTLIEKSAEPEKLKEDKMKEPKIKMRDLPELEFKDLEGMIFKEVKKDECSVDFVTEDGTTYSMFHDQDCCEHVELKDICGDLNDLVGTPIISFEERTNKEEPIPDNYEEMSELDRISFTWTFYTIRTAKGTVDITFLGQSNGCYSEDASLFRLTDDGFTRKK